MLYRYNHIMLIFLWLSSFFKIFLLNVMFQTFTHGDSLFPVDSSSLISSAVLPWTHLIFSIHSLASEHSKWFPYFFLTKMLPKACLLSHPVQEFQDGSVPPAFLSPPKWFSEMIKLTVPQLHIQVPFFTSLNPGNFWVESTDQEKATHILRKICLPVTEKPLAR